MAVSKRIRTDLALETTERFKEENTEIRGVEIQEDYDGKTAGNLHYNRSSGSVCTG